jgi:hypothetical protein
VPAAQLGFRPTGRLEEATRGERNSSRNVSALVSWRDLVLPVFIKFRKSFSNFYKT